MKTERNIFHPLFFSPPFTPSLPLPLLPFPTFHHTSLSTHPVTQGHAGVVRATRSYLLCLCACN